MYLFLYKAARHGGSRYSRRYVQNTIRGDFDLDVLRRGIKDRYKIIPHGEHPFQKFLSQMEMQEQLYGHIVAIDEPKNAVWFKLNYDQVGKGSTTYLGGWKDLDPEDLKDKLQEYKTLSESLASVSSITNSLKYSRYHLAQWANKDPETETSRYPRARDVIHNAIESMTQSDQVAKATQQFLDSEILDLKQKIQNIKAEVLAYMKQRAL
jgi:hypothetical protein